MKPLYKLLSMTIIGLLLFFNYHMFAQQSKLVGVGSSNGGHIFMFDESSIQPDVIFSFNETASPTPFGVLVEFNNRLWGLAGDNIFIQSSGSAEQGAIYSIAKDGTDFRIDFDFSNNSPLTSTGNGRSPQGSLILYQEALWGLTYAQGDYGGGALFKFDPTAKSYEVVYSFSKATGYLPLGPMILNEDALYGVTWTGGPTGSYGQGTIFKFDLLLREYTMLIEFPSTLEIPGPGGERVSIINGRLWGMTKNRGANQSKGIIYSLNLDGTDFKEEYEFSYRNELGFYEGYNPWGAPISVNNELFGFTQLGGENDKGVIFSLNPDGTGYDFLYHFDDSTGRLPLGSPILHQGRLYGAAQLGGQDDGGTIFSIDVLTSTFEVHHHFSGESGFKPVGDFIIIDDVIWGTTLKGGKYGFGSLYSYDLTTGVYAKKVDFNFKIGKTPNPNLVFKDDKLWGLTQVGGFSERGTIFQLDLASRELLSVHEFNSSSSGKYPYGGLLSVDSTFLGMTQSGGANNRGTVFRIGDDINHYVTTSLNNSTVFPLGSLIKSNNRAWGLAQTGGSKGYGGIFSVNLGGTDYQLEHDFTQGAYPYGNLTAVDSKLWGMTWTGGINGGGVIFRLDTTNSNLEIVHDYVGTTGKNPHGTLTLSNNTLYGMTTSGGTLDHGVIFSIAADGTNYTKIHDFDGTNGSYPTGELIEWSGKLWGQTKEGGSENLGIVFKINKDGTAFEKVFDLTTETGGNSTNAKLSVIQLKAVQNLTFDIGNKVYGDEPFLLQATSNTTTPIQYISQSPDIIEIVNDKATVNNAGQASILALQESSPDKYE